MFPPTALAAAVLALPLLTATVASAQPRCGLDEPDALRFALAQTPFEPLTGAKWDPTPVGSNYDPCARLSAVLLTVERATAGSPVQALLFHHGEYVGTGTARAHGFTSLNEAASSDDTVVLTYKVPGECTACPPAAVYNVRYRWQDGRVVMLDPPPRT
ncbi:LppP/LprE family lipoprotein [Mycolicibacterium phlei]